MLKKFISGLFFGGGFMVAAIIIYTAWILWLWPLTVKVSFPEPEVVESAPKVDEKDRRDVVFQNAYLGTTVTYSGDFSAGRKGKVLASGPGAITGNAMLSGKPATGLKVRLALNGEVMSQWAEVDGEGKYTIKVPYGEYRDDGFEIDSQTAHKVLAGKILDPNSHCKGGLFEVSSGSDGKSVDFNFIDPVKLKLDKKEFSSTENVQIEWEPYPEAIEYAIQVVEFKKPYSFGRDSQWFEWQERPKITGNSVDLNSLGHKVKSGYYYIVKIEAINEDSEVISETPWTRTGYDIRVKE